MKKKLWVLPVLCLLVLTLLSVTAQAGWKTTSDGKIYTSEASPGYLTGWQTIDGATYYFNGSGIMQTGWKKISGKYYYFGSKGKMRTGFLVLEEKVYYLGTDGARRTGWQTIATDDAVQTYYFNKKGVMLTGLNSINKKLYYFSPNGVLQKGYIRVDGKIYYGDKTTGVLAQNKWVGDYFFQPDGTMLTGELDSEEKYAGAKTGWVTESGKKHYYDRNGKQVFGWLTISGNKYYLDKTSGDLQTGWFTVGRYKYYANSKGVIQKNKWVGNKYLKSTGAMATSWTTISGSTYYFRADSGEYLTGWKIINKKYYYFSSKGVLAKKTWIDKKYFVGADGARVMGVKKIGKKYYYFSKSANGLLLKGWIRYGKDIYYAHSSQAYLFVSTWFTKGSYKYYAGKDGKIFRGLKKISGKIYYFNSSNGRMLTNAMKKVSGSTYYFGSDGAAVKSKWVNYNSKYYYFESTGKMATNKWVDSHYVGADGVRDDTKKLVTGLQTVDGKKYYYDSQGNQVKGWQSVNGGKYYFGSDGAAVTGLQVINSKKYYFYPSGIQAVGLTLAVGNKEYTINSSGVVTSEKTIKITGNTKGSQIAEYGIKFIGNPYVYGGTSLTGGADCSGFVFSVFAHFDIKLLRVADDQMKGPSQAYIDEGYKKAVIVTTDEMLPGDLVFYGSSNYASHVGIYIGNGNIVHASNSQPYPAGGIKISPYNYNTPVRVVRYWS